MRIVSAIVSVLGADLGDFILVISQEHFRLLGVILVWSFGDHFDKIIVNFDTALEKMVGRRFCINMVIFPLILTSFS